MVDKHVFYKNHVHSYSIYSKIHINLLHSTNLDRIIDHQNIIIQLIDLMSNENKHKIIITILNDLVMQDVEDVQYFLILNID
jgi:hypothetical protein